jgi:hypothetical protein
MSDSGKKKEGEGIGEEVKRKKREERRGRDRGGGNW